MQINATVIVMLVVIESHRVFSILVSLPSSLGERLSWRRRHNEYQTVQEGYATLGIFHFIVEFSVYGRKGKFCGRVVHTSMRR